MADVIREALYARSRAAWRLIRRGQDAEVRANEETITNLILIELSLLKAPGLSVRAFTKHQESKTGADWEMWLGNNVGQWLGLRIQAKAIDLDSRKFPHLHYRASATSPFQSDTLIDKALASSPRLYPLYVLYTYAPPGTLRGGACRLYPRRTTVFGCSAVSAFQVQALRSPTEKNSLVDLSPHMFPWHCLVCRCYNAEVSLPHRAALFLRSQLSANYAEMAARLRGQGPDPGDEREFRYLRMQPDISERRPEYVTDLMADREPALPDDLSAVVAIQENASLEPVG